MFSCEKQQQFLDQLDSIRSARASKGQQLTRGDLVAELVYGAYLNEVIAADAGYVKITFSDLGSGFQMREKG